MNELHNRVLSFLFRLRSASNIMDVVYTEGGCYRLYELLKFVFDSAEPYYNQDHVITKIAGRFYDILGEVEDADEYERMDWLTALCAESSSSCHITNYDVRSETWTSKDEMRQEIADHLLRDNILPE